MPPESTPTTSSLSAPGARQYTSPQSFLGRFSRTTLIVWLVALSLVVFFLPLQALGAIARADINGMQNELDSVQLALVNVPTPVPEVRKVLTPLAQVQGQLNQIKAVYPTLAAARSDWPTLMGAIGNYNSDLLTVTTMSRADNQITLNGRAVDEPSLFAYTSSLEQSGLFDRVVIQSVQISSTVAAKMTLTANTTVTPTRMLTPTVTATATPKLGDAFEPDEATPAPIAFGQAQQRNFYPSGDVDSSTFLAKAGRYYRVSTTNLAPGVDTVLTVRLGGTTYSNDDTQAGTLASLVEFRNNGGDTTALITVTNRGQYGSDKTYSLLVEDLAPTPTSSAPALTPASAATSTFVPAVVPTNTSVPERTNTPVPTPTNTLVPTSTPTPVPSSTQTPTIVPPTATWTATATAEPTNTFTPTFTPSSTAQPPVLIVNVNVSPLSSTSCPQTFTFSADLLSSSAGTVKYHWEFSDHSTSADQEYTFPGAGSQTVQGTWDISGSPLFNYSGWGRVQITAPVALTSTPANFTLTCLTAPPMSLLPATLGDTGDSADLAWRIIPQAAPSNPHTAFRIGRLASGIMGFIGLGTELAGQDSSAEPGPTAIPPLSTGIQAATNPALMPLEFVIILEIKATGP